MSNEPKGMKRSFTFFFTLQRQLVINNEVLIKPNDPPNTSYDVLPKERLIIEYL